jgi:2,3-bisphosphoglycerate-dependent phosphoglycerate mutase
VPVDRPSSAGAQLVLLRHGESEWNRDGRFTGWTDVELSTLGVQEATRAGAHLREAGFEFDCCFTSVLRRATDTAEIVLQSMRLAHVPVEQTWRLNERHYGALQGMGQWHAMCRYGPLSVLRCQYRFAARPPALALGDPRFPGNDPRYAPIPADELPRAESHADTLARLQPYWVERIAPALAQGLRVLVVSHKNTLRALVRLIERRPDTGTRSLRIPTGVPLVFVPDRVTPERWYQRRDR